jgi:sortase A
VERTPRIPVTWLRAAARRYRNASARGYALGHLRIPRLDLDMVFVNGTDSTMPRRGPGRYAGRGSYMPGEGQLVYLAGHRTTYAAPFSDIDDLERGDAVVVEVPYARFEYRVKGHEIVAPTSCGCCAREGVRCWPCRLAIPASSPRTATSSTPGRYA